MNDNVVRFKIPQGRGKLTGTTIARVTGFESTKSKIDGAPQIAFDFTTRKNTRFTLWMSCTSNKAVFQFMEAGILRRIGAEEFEPVPLGLQPELRVALKEGKLQGFYPLDEESA